MVNQTQGNWDSYVKFRNIALTPLTGCLIRFSVRLPCVGGGGGGLSSTPAGPCLRGITSKNGQTLIQVFLDKS